MGIECFDETELEPKPACINDIRGHIMRRGNGYEPLNEVRIIDITNLQESFRL